MSSLQSCERIYFCCLDHTVYGILLGQPELNKTPSSYLMGIKGTEKGTITVCWEVAEAPLERTGGLRISRETGDRPPVVGVWPGGLGE